MAGDFGLRVMNKNGQVYRFGGFNETDYDKLNKFFSRNYSIDLKTRDNCLRGWNWGTANFDGSVLGFDIRKGERAFEVPLMHVSQCTTAKNEVTLEFHHNDDAPNSLMEMRFHIPTIDGVDTVQAFMDHVLDKAAIIEATGDAIATFKELQCLTPRGRYDIKIFPTFIQLHGKTFDYKIAITSVLRLFQLPHKDSRQVFFVMSLDPPIRQGQTRYHFLILLFNKDEELLIELSASDRDFAEKYDGKLQKTMSGPVYELVAKLMRVMVQRKITLPNQTFCSPKDIPVITCSYRASAGLLYPLERGFIYLHKPPVHIRFEEIQSINFARSGGSTRSFDFEVETKNGFVHTFSSIEKEEYSKLFDFVSNKKLRVKNRGTEGEKSRSKTMDDDIVDSDLEDEPDAYLQRVREEGRIRTEAGDDSEESDEDFNPDAKGSGDSDDVAEEYDSAATASDSEDSEEGDGHKKKKKEKKEKHKTEKKKKKEKSDKPRKSKKDKDENKPKRPQTPFFLWLNDSREKIKKDNPGLSVTEVGKKAGELWKEVKDKAKWEEKAAQAKKVYEKQMEEYKASGGGSEKTSKKSSPKKSTKSETKKSPTKSGSFKSKEYIESDSDSSSDSDTKKKKKSKDKKQEKVSKKKKKDESDVEMKSDVSEASASTPESSEDSD